MPLLVTFTSYILVACKRHSPDKAKQETKSIKKLNIISLVSYNLALIDLMKPEINKIETNC